MEYHDTIKLLLLAYVSGTFALLGFYFLILMTYRELYKKPLSQSIKRAARKIISLETNSIPDDSEHSRTLKDARIHLGLALQALSNRQYSRAQRTADKAYSLALQCEPHLSLNKPLRPVPPLARIVDETGFVWLD